MRNEASAEGKTSSASLAAAAAALRQGHVVAFPTETVYGLGVRMGDRAAKARLMRIKRRPAGKPFQILLSSRRRAIELCGRMPGLARRLMDTFWPGPLTLVIRARNGRWVGLRMPAHHVARSLARRVGGAILATSANVSGRRPARTAQEVKVALGERVKTVVDGGRCRLGKPSSVVRVSGDRWEMLRTGAITARQIKQITGTSPISRGTLS